MLGSTASSKIVKDLEGQSVWSEPLVVRGNILLGLADFGPPSQAATLSSG